MEGRRNCYEGQSWSRSCELTADHHREQDCLHHHQHYHFDRRRRHFQPQQRLQQRQPPRPPPLTWRAWGASTCVAFRAHSRAPCRRCWCLWTSWSRGAGRLVICLCCRFWATQAKCGRTTTSQCPKSSWTKTREKKKRQHEIEWKHLKRWSHKQLTCVSRHPVRLRCHCNWCHHSPLDHRFPTPQSDHPTTSPRVARDPALDRAAARDKVRVRTDRNPCEAKCVRDRAGRSYDWRRWFDANRFPSVCNSAPRADRCEVKQKRKSKIISEIWPLGTRARNEQRNAHLSSSPKGFSIILLDWK